MSTIVIDKQTVHYEVLGRGRPVLFLHGWVGSYRCWIPAMQAISTYYRSYAIDLWGFGGSARDPTRYLIANQKDLIFHFMNEMNIKKTALIGHGLGAILSLMFTVEHPKMVDRIMAVSLSQENELISPLLFRSSPSELAEWLLGNTSEAEAVRKEALKADQNAVLRALDNLRSLKLSELMDQCKKPCLFVNGINDPAITNPTEDKNKHYPPNFHQILFTQSGHFPMIDQHGKFNRLMFDFLYLESGKNPSELQLKDEWKRRLR